MKKKLVMILLCGVLLVGMTGCGSKESKVDSGNGVAFDYSKMITNSENIGKNVDVKTVLNEKINPGSYEGVEFDIDVNDLSKLNKDAGNLNWLILAEDDKNYMLTTVKPTTETIELKGADGYNNGVQALNAYCAKYYSVDINGKKYVARNINMNDIEMYYKDKTDSWKQDTLGFENYNKTGVEAQGYQYYPSLYSEEIGSNMGGKLETSETPKDYEPYNNSYKSNGSSTKEYLDTYYYANKTQLKDNFDKEKAYSIIFDSGSSYWISTRSVMFYDSKMRAFEIQRGSRDIPAGAEFGMRMVSGGELKQFRLMQSNKGSEAFYKNMISVRPVVVVPKSEIKL